MIALFISWTRGWHCVWEFYSLPWPLATVNNFIKFPTGLLDGSYSQEHGLPWWLSGKEYTCQCRRHWRCGFDLWIKKISWRRKWQPTPVFLSGKSHEQRSLAGYGITKSQIWLSMHALMVHSQEHVNEWHVWLWFSKDLGRSHIKCQGFPGGSVGKELTCNAGDAGSIPGLGRSPGGGHGDPLQYCCLENCRDRGAWRATVHGVSNSQMWLKQLCTHAYILNGNLRLQMSSAVFIHVWAAGECEERDSPRLQAAYLAHTKNLWTAPSCLRCPSGKRAERIIFF